MGASRRAVSNNRGFTITELMIVVVLVALLMSTALPMYREHVTRARNTKAVADIASLHIRIDRFRLSNGDRLPGSLSELGVEIPADPWGRPYEFLNIRETGNLGKVRKDGRLNPLNTDYDLYSAGEDGESASPLSARKSRDDIVRANNGSYIGLGADY